MSDLRKVVTALTPNLESDFPTGTPTNYFQSYESDKPVHWSKTGHIDSHYPVIKTGVLYKQADNPLPDPSAITNAHILGGPYIDVAMPLLAAIPPWIFDPRRIAVVRGTGSGSNQNWTFPTPAVIVAYLKQLYGAENVLAGFCWEVTIVNDNVTYTLTLIFGGITANGQNKVGGVDRHLLAVNSSARLIFRIRHATPGSEAVDVIVC